MAFVYFAVSFLPIFGLLFCPPSLNGATPATLMEEHQTPLAGQIDPFFQQIKEMPKRELHLHLGGAWPIAFLKEISDPQEFKELCDMLDRIEKGVDYHAIFQVFKITGKLVNTDERFENGVYALCQELVQDNVVYAEFRTGLKDLGTGLEGYLKAVLKGIKRGTEGKPLKVGLLLSMRRDTPAAIAEKTIDLALKYRQEGIVGIDLSGDSTSGDGNQIFSALARAKANHLPITLHIGESKEEKAEQQMKELLLLQPERVGHCVHLCDEARQWIKENGVPVEMCLSSAVKAAMIVEPKDHPALQWLREGHPVVICTDDPLIFRTTLSQECAMAAKLAGLSWDDMQALQQKSEDYIFYKQ